MIPPVNVDVPVPPTRMVDDACNNPPTMKSLTAVDEAVEINPSILPRLSMENNVVEAELTISNVSAVWPVCVFKVSNVELVLVAPSVSIESGSGVVVPMPKAEVAANSVVVPIVETPVPNESDPPPADVLKMLVSALMSKREDPVVTCSIGAASSVVPDE